MDEKQILQTIKDLSKSQGFYCGLYDYITSESGKSFLENLVSQNFKDKVDLILYLES